MIVFDSQRSFWEGASRTDLQGEAGLTRGSGSDAVVRGCLKFQ